MEYFLIRYDSRVIIYEHKMFIRLATDVYLRYVVFITMPMRMLSPGSDELIACKREVDHKDPINFV